MKNKIKKILCPIDFNAASTNAMDYAAKLSKELNASLTLWNMCEIPIIDEMASSNLSKSINRKKKELADIMLDWCTEIKEEYAITCGYFVDAGIENLERTLARYTNGKNFDLIVAGTNGTDNMYQFFFGTNSYRIIKEVKCPVMIVPENYTFKKLNSVVFATDYNLDDAKLAKVLAQTFNLSITFVHLSKKESDMSKTVYQSFKNLFEEELDHDFRVRFEWLFEEDKLDGLVEKMIEKEADMVILSTNHKKWFEDLFHKSFTKQVLDGIQIPTLVFHQSKNIEEGISIRLEG